MFQAASWAGLTVVQILVHPKNDFPCALRVCTMARSLASVPALGYWLGDELATRSQESVCTPLTVESDR